MTSSFLANVMTGTGGSLLKVAICLKGSTDGASLSFIIGVAPLVGLLCLLPLPFPVELLPRLLTFFEAGVFKADFCFEGCLRFFVAVAEEGACVGGFGMVDFLTGLVGLLASVADLVFVGAAASFTTAGAAAGAPTALGGMGRCVLCLIGVINTL